MKRRKKAPSVGFVSLGCPKATVDAEQILTRLRAEGYDISASYDGADLVVVNTCGFIDAAVEESLEAIGEALAENGRVIVTGCLGAKRSRGNIVRETHPKVLAVTGPHALAGGDGRGASHLPPLHDPFIDLVPPQGIKLTPEHYAYLKISEGCNHRCSFCIIPSLRGDLVSRPIGEVMQEAENLAKAGVKELLIVSQDTSAYGVDVKYRTGFWGGKPVKTKLFDLARALGDLGMWVRLHYVYPVSQRRRPAAADGRGQDPALPRRAVPARQPAHPQADEAAGRRGKDSRAHCRLAPGGAGPDHPLDFHHGLSRRDRGGVQRTAAIPRRRRNSTGSAPSPIRRSTAPRPTSCPARCPRHCARSARARLMAHQEDISTQRLEARIGRTIQVLVDDVDEEGAIARSSADAPEIDGLVYVTDGHDLEIGEFAAVTVTDCDVHDLFAELA